MANNELSLGGLPSTGFVREKLLGNQPKIGYTGLLGISRSTLWRLVAAHQFPEPIKLSAGVTAWRVDDVREWLDRVTGARPVGDRPGLAPFQGFETAAAPSSRTQGGETKPRTPIRPEQRHAARPGVSKQKLEKQLMAEANAWRQAETIRAYVASLAAATAASGTTPGPELCEWFRWALEVAKRVDPSMQRKE